MRTVLVLSLAALACAGCAEREQTASGIKSDAAPFSGTNKQPPFTAAGWKPGDRANWEQQLKVRTVNGQNDYVKVP
ncbi:MAG TPA: hypothetical protein VFM98_03400 [Ramlibacter sp.]|uniref:hypothetical protein n=1 Tax=Ramlibacter sp. TaxID=1917967 RepID=UPI002D80978F|nr:hypothetical protein [Ramlibacter sp.]HET8744625.1 hypothetical protein [Ramlibacter sp.]